MPELREIVPRQRPVAKEPRCAGGLCVKPMLHAPSAPRFDIAINRTEKLGGIGIHAGHD